MGNVILVDCDDTIVNLLETWVTELNKKYHTSVDYRNITEWDMGKSFPTLTRENIVSPLIEDGFWKKVKAKEDAVRALKKLSQEGYEIYVVTATDYRNFSQKVSDVILKWFPFISDQHIISCYKKQMVCGDVLIDDYIENLLGGHYAGILYTTSYNKDIDVSSNNISRANNWSECYKIIHEICPI